MRSDGEFYRNALMAQQLAHKQPLYSKLAGSDREISERMAIIDYLRDPEAKKVLTSDPLLWVFGLLDRQRMAAFATSERTGEVTKLGLGLPKGPNVVDFSETD